MVASALPLAQAPENIATTALLLRSRYDLRALFQSFSMALRLAAIVVGTQLGLVETFAGIVLAQLIATAAVSVVGIKAFRRFPQEAAAGLADDRRGIVSFMVQSSAATGLISLRTAIAPILLGIAAGPTQVGLFRIAQAPQSGFAAASSPVRLILLTEQTRDWERGDEARVLAGVRRYTLLAIPLMLVVVPTFFWLMPDLIRLVFGARYLLATDAARLILVAAGIQLAIGWTKSLPIAIGRPNLRLVTHGIETAVLLPLVVVLGLEWGATGAAAATPSRRSRSRWRGQSSSPGSSVGRRHEGAGRLGDLAAGRRRSREPLARAGGSPARARSPGRGADDCRSGTGHRGISGAVGRPRAPTGLRDALFASGWLGSLARPTPSTSTPC